MFVWLCRLMVIHASIITTSPGSKQMICFGPDWPVFIQSSPQFALHPDRQSEDVNLLAV